MPLVHYRLATAFAASLSLLLAACGSTPPSAPPSTPSAAGPSAAQSDAANANKQQVAAKASDGIDTEATLWTVLGLAKEGTQREPGPQTGSNVSPVLWQAALDTLHFTKFASLDPLGGSLVTDWYSPVDKPDERFRIDVFILSRYLNADAVAVTVDRQVQAPSGQWVESPIARKVQEDLETKILYRARQLRQKWIAAAASS
jgi:Domain of unknown function (DUF3576)